MSRYWPLKLIMWKSTEINECILFSFVDVFICVKRQQTTRILFAWCHPFYTLLLCLTDPVYEQHLFDIRLLSLRCIPCWRVIWLFGTRTKPQGRNNHQLIKSLIGFVHEIISTWPLDNDQICDKQYKILWDIAELTHLAPELKRSGWEE